MKRIFFVMLVLATQAHAEVTYERLRNAARDTNNWLTYSGTIDRNDFRRSIRSTRTMWTI